MKTGNGRTLESGLKPLSDVAATTDVRQTRTGLRWLIVSLIAAAMVILRVMALRSDPFPRLDWSTGLLTDEGFYIHNARNVILFGHARTDDFNNMLQMPLLHYLQVAVFELFGVGSVQARMISVVLSLFTLVLFYLSLRRAFGVSAAGLATLFLGLDHVNLLYNRMALMETPATFFAVAGFYGCVRWIEQMNGSRAKWYWPAAAGVFVAAACVTKASILFLVPVPLLALWAGTKKASASEESRSKFSIRMGGGWLYVASVMAVAILYFAFWYWPNHSAISEMDHYYRVQQIQPSSLSHLWLNLDHAVFGDWRGQTPYLMRHTPVVFLLALAALITPVGWRDPIRRLLSWWLLLGWTMLAIISYSPSRYYVPVYPAMMALAAIGLVYWRLLVKHFTENGWAGAVRRGLLGGLVAYHALEVAIHHSVFHATDYLAAAFVVGAALCIGVGRRRGAESIQPDSSVQRTSQIAVIVAVAMWMMVNGYWLTCWLTTLSYSQYHVSRELARILPLHSVIIGDMAPGLCLDNRFRAINVIPKLCNWRYPISRFAGRPEYLLILDGNWKERWWVKHYPKLVAQRRRMKLFRVERWTIGLYPVAGWRSG
ncbi:MAG: phospholipid carrier-dependent glycosyltransferase [Armatimonadetes bacterium]|nr:phospholipid carrier-dependent glycosyltransferase [Armatimonadota bacterium]